MTRLCGRDGLLVPANGTLPTEPEEYYHPGMFDAVGCSHLVCGRCGAAVRNATGLVPHGSRFDAEEAYAANDLARLPYMHAGPRESADFRFYLCRCMNVIVGRATALDAEPEGDEPRLPWKCAGHPDQAVPFVFCGVSIGRDTNFVDLVTRNFQGWAPDAARPLERRNAGMWINRLYARLLDTGLEGALGTAVSTLLTSTDVGLLGDALDFYLRYPLAAGADGLVALWDTEKDGRLTQVHPRAKGGQTLGAYVAIALGLRARQGVGDVGAFARACLAHDAFVQQALESR